MLRKIGFITLVAFAMLAVQSPFALASAGGGGKKDGDVTGPQYVELDPLLLPIINDEGISQQVSLIVKLEVKDSAKADELKAVMPKIVDAFVQDLYGALGDNTSFMSNGILRLDLVKTRLKAVAATVVDKDMVDDVLLQVVQQHRV